MEVKTQCRQDPIACFAGELLERWERTHAIVEQGRQDDELGSGAGRECLPCLLEDWDPDLDD